MGTGTWLGTFLFSDPEGKARSDPKWMLCIINPQLLYPIDSSPLINLYDLCVLYMYICICMCNARITMNHNKIIKVKKQKSPHFIIKIPLPRIFFFFFTGIKQNIGSNNKSHVVVVRIKISHRCFQGKKKRKISVIDDVFGVCGEMVWREGEGGKRYGFRFVVLDVGWSLSSLAQHFSKTG